MAAALSGPILAVDPGDVRIGIALSDASGTVARPVTVLRHRSRTLDAAAILRLASEHSAKAILVGLALDQDGAAGPQARKALRLVAALRQGSEIPVETWDESGTTQAAVRLGDRDGLLDARAAAILLQDYLNARAT